MRPDQTMPYDKTAARDGRPEPVASASQTALVWAVIILAAVAAAIGA